ncbi:MAG: hypothetical protein KAY24_18215 [Candidatus Eisenbacteria sp.]|nr:hypothetical protein [Candidatus Eisenbacteria bacterium]
MKARWNAWRRSGWPSPRHLVLLALIFITASCDLETPESPSLHIEFNLPLDKTVTGLEIADSLDSVEGDSTHASPLTVEFDGEMNRFSLEEALDLRIDQQTYRAELEQINFTPPQIDPVFISLAEIAPSPLPPYGTHMTIDPFAFTTGIVDLGTHDDFQEIVFTSGTLTLTFSNNSGIPLGAEYNEEHALTIHLEDLSTSPQRLLASQTIPGEIASGEAVPIAFDLSGMTVGNHLGFWLQGWSPGGEIESSPDLGLNLAFAFLSVEVNRLIGDLPALSVETTGSVEPADGISLNRAEIRDGSFYCSLRSELPVDATLELWLPELFRPPETASFDTSLTLPACGTLQLHLPLAGCIVETDGKTALAWNLALATQPTDSPESIQLGMGVESTFWTSEIHVERISGVFDHKEIVIDPTEIDVDLPEEIKDMEFVSAEAEIVVRSTAGVAAAADLALVGYADGDSVSVTFPAAVGAGSAAQPSEQRIALTANNSNIVDLINLQPEKVRLGGTLWLGDAVSVGELRADDYVEGSFTVRAPMKLILQTVHYEGDPEKLELDDDARDLIEENLEQVTIELVAENHFPAGAELRLHFARTEPALFIGDDLILESQLIDAAQIDRVTGRVTEATTTTVYMHVTEEDVDLFAEEVLYVGIELTLIGDGEDPVAFWTTDYLRLKGAAKLLVLIE